MSEKVTVVAYGETLPGKEAEFLTHVQQVVAATRQETACINYDFHQLVETPQQFMFYENWTSLDGLKAHSESAHIQTFRASIAQLLAKPIEIKIYRMVTEPVA